MAAPKNRYAKAASLPYFIRDNQSIVDGILNPDENSALSSPKHRGPKSSSRKQSKTSSSQARKISKLSDISDMLEAAGVESIAPGKLKTTLSEDEIISKLGGHDITDGSCVSQTLAYIANKFRYDVLDYRGGKSCEILADMDNAIAKAVGGIVRENRDGISLANELLSYVKPGKEYVLSVGEHYAVVRARGGVVEYLEVQQEDENGFHPLTNDKLKVRFGCRIYKEKRIGSLTDIEFISNNRGLYKLLGYLSTKK